MENIWSFLLQTLTVALTAAFLLVLKALFRDKLSPRWQYGVWSLLALRILLPVTVKRNVLLPLPLWTEMAKSMAEVRLDSAYSGAYENLSLGHVLPVLRGAPASLTDWLFAAYALGVAAVLLRYFLSYIRLRRLLRRGRPVTSETMELVCEKYGLKPCPMVALPGLQSAFVCGLLHPVLAVPEGEAVEEKILLHELLHVKYFDAWQSVGWCVLRALHWCDPLLWPVFRRIENDMESLCDQRVLERLDGEERRAYGVILLDMANEKYARAPGTTSISNGGKNIARRIEAIVRFKKYPRGMALVSLCILLVLCQPLLLGYVGAYGLQDYLPSRVRNLPRAMAVSRINRCTTPAGALDAYARGLLADNGVYIAMASPLSAQERIAAQMEYNATVDNWVAYHLDGGPGLESADELKGYGVYNFTEDGNGGYTAILALPVMTFHDPVNGGYLEDETGEPYRDCALLIPVRVYQSDGWVVEETGERSRFTEAYVEMSLLQSGDICWKMEKTLNCESGTVEFCSGTIGTVENARNTVPNPHGAFQKIDNVIRVTYKPKAGAKETIGIQVVRVDSPSDDLEYLNKYDMTDSGGGSDCQGLSFSNGYIDVLDGVVRIRDDHDDMDPAAWGKNNAYRLRLFWDGELVEEVILSEEAE